MAWKFEGDWYQTRRIAIHRFSFGLLCLYCWGDWWDSCESLVFGGSRSVMLREAGGHLSLGDGRSSILYELGMGAHRRTIGGSLTWFSHLKFQGKR